MATLGLITGGSPAVTNTEEWNFTSTLAAGAWASGTNFLQTLQIAAG